MPEDVAVPASLSSLQDRVVDEAVSQFIAGEPDPYRPGAADEEVPTDGTPAPTAAPASPATTGVKPDTTVDDKGRSHGPDGKFLPVAEGAADGAADGASEGAEGQPADEAVAAEGAEPAEPATPKEPVKLATEFAILGADGKPVDVADVLAKLPRTTFKVGEKEYDLPYDRVVRLAKSGIHNEEQDRQAKAAIGERDSLAAELENAKGAVERQNAFIAQFFEALSDVALDENHPAAHILSRWQQFNSPEARAQRAEAELHQLRQEQHGQSVRQQATSFVENDVRAPIKALLQQFPTLTEREILGEFNLRTAKFGAVIQPKDYAAVKAILMTEIPAWAAGRHEESQATGAALTKARETTTILKKRVAQGARPVGRVASSAESRPTPKQPRTMDERINAAVDEALAGI